MQKCKTKHLQQSNSCHQNGKCSSNTAAAKSKHINGYIQIREFHFEDIYQLNMKLDKTKHDLRAIMTEHQLSEYTTRNWTLKTNNS